MRRSRSIVFAKVGQPLACIERDVDEPRSHELLLRITHAGVCGSDIHRLAGDLGEPPVPICFGHEGIGVIEVLGSQVTHDQSGKPIRVGDRIYYSPVTPCGECAVCRGEKPGRRCGHSLWPVPFGGPNPAAYQDLATVHSRAPFYRIPDPVSSDSVIAFGCAMPTALGGMLRLGDVRGAIVVIQGSGPVGLATCLIVRRSGAKKVIVLGEPQARLDIANRFGADEVVSISSTSREERRHRIMALTNGEGADIVIEAAGRMEAFVEGFDLVASYGRYLIMGLYSGFATTPVNPVAINNRNISIIGSLGFPSSEIGRTVEVAEELGARFEFDKLVTHCFPLERTEAAIACASRGEPIKAVVMPTLVI